MYYIMGQARPHMARTWWCRKISCWSFHHLISRNTIQWRFSGMNSERSIASTTVFDSLETVAIKGSGPLTVQIFQRFSHSTCKIES